MAEQKGSTADELKKLVLLHDVAAGAMKLEKRGSEWWACCPFHGEDTPSFKISEHKGCEVFHCFGCGKSGSVVDFIELHEHLTTAEAFKRLNELAGTTEWREEAKKVQATFKNIGDVPKTTMPLIAWASKEAALLKNPDALKWLTETRGISIETAQALHFGFAQSTKNKIINPENEQYRDKGWVMFPRIVGDKIVAIKMRSIACKEFTQVAGMDPKALFNSETVNMLEPVFVVEGECDAAIMEQADFRTVSIPNSTTKITPEWKVILKKAPFVVLAGDNDGKAGSDQMRLLQNELGENTHLLLWPGVKDANDFFRETCNRQIEIFREKVLELVEISKSTPVDGFMSIIQRLRTSAGTDGENDPFRMHFSIPQLDRMAYVPIDAGYCIFYSTYSGTGKSVFTTQVMIEEAKNDQVVVVYSPELSGSAYLALVAAQTLPERNINRSLIVTQDDYLATANKLDVPTKSGGSFQYYVGHTIPGGDPLEFIEMTLKVIRPTRFVIDTFPCVVVKQRGESQVDAESRTASMIEALGKKYGCIFVIIGQSNKEAEDLKEKRRDSHGVLRGSRVLYDKAHAIFLIHRKKKEDGTGQDDLLESSTLVKMEKNRTSGPGAQQIFLTYVRAKSRFYFQEQQEKSAENAVQSVEDQIY
jgi:hypothetical protein